MRLFRVDGRTQAEDKKSKKEEKDIYNKWKQILDRC